MDVLEVFASHLMKQGVSSELVAQVTGRVRQELGGQQHYVRGQDYPSRDASIRDEYRKCHSFSRVAAKFGLSERRVREIVG